MMFGIRKMFMEKNKIDEKGLKIIYESGVVKNEVMSWIKCLGISDFRQVLVNFGFNDTDIIYLYESYGNLYRINYSVNDNKYNNENSIQFNYKKKEFIVNNEYENKCYSMEILDNGKIQMNLDYCKRRISDKVTYFYKYCSSNSLFIIDNGDYELIFEMYLVDGASYSFLEIVDKDVIEEYLTSLDFPVVIDDVYIKLCEILNLDISIMEMFNLTVTKNIGKKKVDIVTDEILIQKGELCRVTKSDNRRRVTIDKDGNCSYDNLDNEFVFSVKYNECNEPKYRYSFKGISESTDVYFSEDELVELKKDASEEVENVKKLARVIVSNKNNKNGGN